jgi:Uma2 family endonuclease
MPAIEKFTYEDYAAMPNTGKRYQLVEGELIVSPSPTVRHQIVMMRIANALYNHVEAKRAGLLLAGPVDAILSDEDVYVPDIVFVSKARKKIIAPEGFRGAPDLCVEVLSPSNRRLDVKTKRANYAKFGVPELWIVDPDEDNIRLFRLQENPTTPQRVFEENDTLKTTLLPEFELKLGPVFER